MSRDETLSCDYDPYREFYEQGDDGGDYRPLRQVARPRQLTPKEQRRLQEIGAPPEDLIRLLVLEFIGSHGEQRAIFKERK